MFADSKEYSDRRDRGFFRSGRRGGRYGRRRLGLIDNFHNLEVNYDAETFIKNLVNISSIEFEKIKNEITSNNIFYQQMTENRRRFGGGFYGID